LVLPPYEAILRLVQEKIGLRVALFLVYLFMIIAKSVDRSRAFNFKSRNPVRGGNEGRHEGKFPGMQRTIVAANQAPGSVETYQHQKLLY
jgi:hypothetical protein